MSKVITILLPDGNSIGVKILELANFTGKAFVIPRGNLKDVKDRPESQFPAIYYLFGEGESESRKLVYIGESEKFYQRLTNHDANKDFWNLAVVFSGGLDRADVKYLENQSVALAKKINRYDIKNETEPLENKLSESKKAIIDDYFERIKFILAFLGFALFQGTPNLNDALEIYYFKTEDADATGTLLENNEFLVYKGSTARIRVTLNFENHDPGIRKRLENDGVFKRQENGKSFIFLKDQIFTSPSAAGDTVAGRSINGWTAWKDKNGKTLDENVRK